MQLSTIDAGGVSDESNVGSLSPSNHPSSRPLKSPTKLPAKGSSPRTVAMSAEQYELEFRPDLPTMIPPLSPSPFPSKSPRRRLPSSPSRGGRTSPVPKIYIDLAAGRISPRPPRDDKSRNRHGPVPEGSSSEEKPRERSSRRRSSSRHSRRRSKSSRHKDHDKEPKTEDSLERRHSPRRRRKEGEEDARKRRLSRPRDPDGGGTRGVSSNCGKEDAHSQLMKDSRCASRSRRHSRSSSARRPGHRSSSRRRSTREEEHQARSASRGSHRRRSSRRRQQDQGVKETSLLNNESKSGGRPVSESPVTVRHGRRRPVKSVEVETVNLTLHDPSSKNENDVNNEQMQASLMLQRAWRCHMAEVKYRQKVKTRSQKLMEKASSQERDRQVIQLQAMTRELEGIERRKNEEQQRLRYQLQLEKDLYKEQVKRRMESSTKNHEEDSKDPRAEYDRMQLQIAELMAESESFKVRQSTFSEKIAGVQEDNSKLQKANNEIATLFESLNQFARKETENKKKLASASETLSKIYKPKLLASLMEADLNVRNERNQKESTRHCIYKLAGCIRSKEDFDHRLLFQDVMTYIKQCEESLGNTTLAVPVYPSGDHSKVEWALGRQSTTLINGEGNDEEPARSSNPSTSSPSEDNLSLQRSISEALKKRERSLDEVVNLTDFLDCALQIECEVDCQSHDTWRNEHGSLLSSLPCE